ncbi:unnamed protein product [Oikopleura dioica]|uniref:AP complex subunit sigma n=1 Tax=Oikopleura dioica TaxID=34765 RepID=E4WVX4_OIKDI|nr:unnamed protein product [Oikopleura dioica]CBY33019.1 unnamed protein product [Oikopleura dioica]
MYKFMILFSRQGKIRLTKWFHSIPDKEGRKISRDIVSNILQRKPKMSNFVDFMGMKVVYKRYASLYFCCGVDEDENELEVLEVIHRYVEILDKYFGSVCELDIIFNYEKAYFVLDEYILAGLLQESSKKKVLSAIEAADQMQEEDQEQEVTRSILEEFGLT